jgi:hypothetical protein
VHEDRNETIACDRAPGPPLVWVGWGGNRPVALESSASFVGGLGWVGRTISTHQDSDQARLDLGPFRFMFSPFHFFHTTTTTTSPPLVTHLLAAVFESDQAQARPDQTKIRHIILLWKHGQHPSDSSTSIHSSPASGPGTHPSREGRGGGEEASTYTNAGTARSQNNSRGIPAGWSEAGNFCARVFPPGGGFRVVAVRVERR